MTWKVHIEQQPWRMATRLHMVRKRADGRRDVVLPLTMDTAESGDLARDHGGILGDVAHEEAAEFLRAFMDAGWELGIRPTKFASHADELAAVRYHLEDMRQLVGVKVSAEPRREDKHDE